MSEFVVLPKLSDKAHAVVGSRDELLHGDDEQPLRTSQRMSGTMTRPHAGKWYSISYRNFCCFSYIIVMVHQNSPTVEFWQEKIESNLRRANTEPSVDFRKANTEHLCILGGPIRNRLGILGGPIRKPIRNRM